MNREELKKHITNFRLNLPQGVKFSVIAQSSAVLESSKDLHCEYLYVAMERPGYNWARVTYGEMETRLEGTWIGNSWLKVYPCYDEEHLVMVDNIPCQYVGETNPFQNDPMLERPVPRIEDFISNETPSQRRFRMAMPEGYSKREDERHHDLAMRGRGDLVGLALTGKNVDFADVVGDYLGLNNPAEQVMESRSASKSLLGSFSLKDTPYGEFQAYRRSRLGSSEYRTRKLKLIEEELKFTEDEVNNRRRLNNASLYLKVMHKRAVRGLDRALAEESMTARCMPSPGGHIEPDDHTVDSIAVAMGTRREPVEEGVFRRPGILRKQLGVKDNAPTMPEEVKSTVEKFVGDEDKKEGEE